MKGVTVPEIGEDFAADPSELFFDLAFVFAFSQLVGILVRDHDWEAVGEAGLLFGIMWMVWSQFTWSANAVPGNQRTVRLVFMIATAASMPMAASISTAFEGGGPVFAISLSVIFFMALTLYVVSVRDQPDIFRSIINYGGIALLSLVPLIIGSFVVTPLRTLLWLAMIAIIGITMVLAGRGDFLVRSGHFAERHGLILIIALGEVIVAVGLPVVAALEEGDGLDGPTLLGLLAAGSFAGILWWAYFDRPMPALEHRNSGLEGRDRGRFSRDVYTIGHLPVIAGVILSAAAVEEITLHPNDPADISFLVMLFGGLGLFLLGVVGAVGRAFRIVARERVAVLVVMAVLLLGFSGTRGVVLLLAIDALLVAMLAAEHYRVELAAPTT